MKAIKNAGLKILAKAILANAKKETASACVFVGYQPQMPEKVKELKRKKWIS